MNMRTYSNFLIWQGRRLLRNVGWFGVAGIGAIIAILLFQLWILLPLNKSVNEMHDEVDRLRESIATRRLVESSQDPGVQLAAFYQFFPKANLMTDMLQDIYAAASHENLLLEHGEYQLIPAQEGNLLRYNLILPIKGPYTNLRRFISKALRDNPNLALEGVNFSRQAIMDMSVNAQVRMTLYLRAE